MVSNRADLLLHERLVLSQRAFVEIVIWRVPAPVPDCQHHFKYRLAYVVNGRCALRFDNEAGKGDHMHVGETGASYGFKDLDTLQANFWRAIGGRRKGR